MREDKKIEVSPSVISGDLANLGSQVTLCEKSGADSFHLDVMDGHFVPNFTMGPDLIKAVRKVTEKRIDAHLMIERPDKYYRVFHDAGSDILLIHYEAPISLKLLFNRMAKENIDYGLVINPETPFSHVKDLVDGCKILLIMSVHPGFSGQSFLESSIPKIREARKYIDDNGIDCRIEIDGGINYENGKKAVEAGTDILVSASYIFYNNIAGSIEKLRSI
ncbi:ribulose-phosphate 3-epimerase [Oxyplasma meridianum]|uniref:Ribulose-phosphate 3-epimerase n=1 Tax=Oxyplasma meridianum TaxID=3073602 RepID=A0AAX4NFK2_9ARCH